MTTVRNLASCDTAEYFTYKLYSNLLKLSYHMEQCTFPRCVVNITVITCMAKLCTSAQMSSVCTIHLAEWIISCNTGSAE